MIASWPGSTPGRSTTEVIPIPTSDSAMAAPPSAGVPGGVSVAVASRRYPVGLDDRSRNCTVVLVGVLLVPGDRTGFQVMDRAPFAVFVILGLLWASAAMGANS